MTYMLPSIQVLFLSSMEVNSMPWVWVNDDKSVKYHFKLQQIAQENVKKD